METITKYRTHDGKIHDTETSAESHALSCATATLCEWFKALKIDNAYGYAQKAISNQKPSLEVLKQVTAWLEDSKIKEER